MSSAIDQLLVIDKDARTTVTSSVTVPFSRDEVWRSLEHLDVRFADPSPFSLEALLPVPVAIRGDGAARGAVRRVELDNGVVVATVTDLVPLEAYEIDLRLEDAGRELFDHWIDLRTSRFDLVDAGSPGAPATTLVHTTTYRPLLFPRVVFEPLERAARVALQLVSLVAGTCVVMPVVASWPLPAWLVEGTTVPVDVLAEALPAAGEALVVGVALALVVAGALVVAWSMRFLLAGGGTPDPFDPPLCVCRSGPYARLRHPMQLGQIGVVLGAALLVGTRGALLAAVAFALFLVGPVRVLEEDVLRGRTAEGA